MSGRRFAILIASSQFLNEPALSPLRFPENDVDGLSKVLRSEERGHFDKVVVLKNVPHHEATLEIHKILSEARKDDLVLIYYSGHGKVNSQRRLHLAMSDTVISALGYTSIPIETVRSLTEEFPSINRKVIILDCCYSGLAGDAFTRRGSLDDQFRAMFGGSGMFLMTASTAYQEANERPEDRYGVFTKHIIRGIRSGEADPDNHGVITMSDLYNYVHKQVCAEGCGQEPMKWDLEVRGGGLVIAKSGKTPKEEPLTKIQKMLSELGYKDVSPDAILSILGKSVETPKKPDPPKPEIKPTVKPSKPQPPVQKPKYQLRKEQITVSDDEFKKVFGLNDKWRPLEYIQNDFKDNGDTITDNATGLIWQKSGSDMLTYENAKAYIQELKRKKFAGFDDWRLPTVDELKSLLTPKEMNGDLYIDPIFDKTQRWYWTSDQRSSGGAWDIGFDGGDVGWRNDRGNYVRAVRSI